MRHLDLTDLVALATEVSEVEMPKLLELLDTHEVTRLLAAARRLPPHEAAAALLAGMLDIGPLPAGNRRLALLAGVHVLAINGLEATLDPAATRDLVAAGADAATLTEWLDSRVTARDPLDGALRERLSPDAWRAIALARQRARRHRRSLATADDLLMGVFREGTGPGAVAMGAGGAGREVVMSAGQPPVPATRPAFSTETRKALERAMRAATSLGHPDINSGHLLLGLLDSGSLGALPDDVSEDEIRRQLGDLLAPRRPATADVARRMSRLADRLRRTDPDAAAELDELAQLQEAGLDRIVDMIRAWRGDIFLDALAGEVPIVRLLGARLGPRPAETADERLLAEYMADIARYPSLSRDEELQLANCIRSAPHREAAMCQRRLIQANLTLVVNVARKYQPVGVPLLDLIQEGNLGLMRAVERYDPAKGYRFATFATWWIRHSIQRAVGRAQS
jgi:hypothetical protein